jgi:hypothetical protein
MMCRDPAQSNPIGYFWFEGKREGRVTENGLFGVK